MFSQATRKPCQAATPSTLRMESSIDTSLYWVQSSWPHLPWIGIRSFWLLCLQRNVHEQFLGFRKQRRMVEPPKTTLHLHFRFICLRGTGQTRPKKGQQHGNQWRETQTLRIKLGYSNRIQGSARISPDLMAVSSLRRWSSRAVLSRPRSSCLVFLSIAFQHQSGAACSLTRAGHEQHLATSLIPYSNKWIDTQVGAILLWWMVCANIISRVHGTLQFWLIRAVFENRPELKMRGSNFTTLTALVTEFSDKNI